MSCTAALVAGEGGGGWLPRVNREQEQTVTMIAPKLFVGVAPREKKVQEDENKSRLA